MHNFKKGQQVFISEQISPMYPWVQFNDTEGITEGFTFLRSYTNKDEFWYEKYQEYKRIERNGPCKAFATREEALAWRMSWIDKLKLPIGVIHYARCQPGVEYFGVYIANVATDLMSNFIQVNRDDDEPEFVPDWDPKRAIRVEFTEKLSGTYLMAKDSAGNSCCPTTRFGGIYRVTHKDDLHLIDRLIRKDVLAAFAQAQTLLEAVRDTTFNLATNE